MVGICSRRKDFVIFRKSTVGEKSSFLFSSSTVGEKSSFLFSPHKFFCFSSDPYFLFCFFVFFLFQLKSVDFQQFNFIARGRHSVSSFENCNTVFELGGIDWIELHSAEIKTCQMGVVGFDASLHSRLGSGVTLHNEKNKTQADMQ